MLQNALRTALLVGIGLATACGRSSQPSPAQPTQASACTPMASHVAAQVQAAMHAEDVDGPVVGQAADAVARVVGSRCERDVWSADAVTCFAGATTATMATCEAKLSAAQREGLQQELDAELAKVVPSTDDGDVAESD